MVGCDFGWRRLYPEIIFVVKVSCTRDLHELASNYIRPYEFPVQDFLSVCQEYNSVTHAQESSIYLYKFL